MIPVHTHRNIEQSGLVDPFNRRIEYVRLSVTDRCNFRCFYCLPKHFRNFETPEQWLSFEEIERIIAAFSELGVERVRLTGGEPLVRKQLPRLIRSLAALPGIEDLSLSTNASLLVEHARELKDSGVSRINVSLDTLREDRFRSVTQGGDLNRVLDGLQAARKAGLNPVKINMVALKGINDDEFEPMVDYCMENGFTLRFIETMPMGEAGRSGSEHYLDLQYVLERLHKRYELVPGVMAGGGPAKYFQVKNTDVRIGFITPISQHFCETCNWVRISVDGTLYLCLGQEHSVELRPLLRRGISDEQLQSVLVDAMRLKPARHEFGADSGQLDRCMSQTGG
mgnify:FL=1